MTRTVTVPDASVPPGPSSASPGKKPRAPRQPRKSPERAAEPSLRSGRVRVGDVLTIERRYVVEGSLTSVTDEGWFKGVELVGSSEHIVLEQGRQRTVHLIPLHTVSEITLKTRAGPESPQGDPFDPSVV